MIHGVILVILRASEGYDELAQKSEKEVKSERRMPRLSGGDERRGKLRKAAGICKQELIRGYLNGETRLVEDQSSSVKMKRTRGTETS